MIELNLSKEQAVHAISLRKEKVVVELKKHDALNGAKARVALVLDFSASTEPDYKNGTMQSVIERIYPIAAVLDDNAELDLWIFTDGFYRIGAVTKENFYGIVKEIMKKYLMGGTSYAPVMKDVEKMYIKELPQNIAEYIIFITDGRAGDRNETIKTIQRTSHEPMFWQFIGVSSREKSFDLLEELDDMEGRYVDNANFFRIKDINAVSDEKLYEMLFHEFPGWLADEKVQAMIAAQHDGQDIYGGSADDTHSAGVSDGRPKKKKFLGLFG